MKRTVPYPEELRKELLERGWTTWKKNPYVWKSPSGLLFRGPYKAWCIATAGQYPLPTKSLGL